MAREIAFFLSVLIWILSILLFKQLRMNFFKFIAGSLGLFIISTIFFINPLENILTYLINNVLSFISNISDSFNVIKEYSLVTINAQNGVLTMLINYECSGIIELLVYSSLIVFFPFISNVRKIYTFIYGNIYIFVVNIIRILFMIFIVNIFGVQIYNLAHTVFARILFFVLILVLYYKVFTKNQIKNQKVGALANE